MKKILIIIIILFSVSFVFGQSRTQEIEDQKGYEYISWQTGVFNVKKVTEIRDTVSSIIRLWKDKTLLILTKNSEGIQGEFLVECRFDLSLTIKKFALDSQISQEVYDYLIQQNLYKIPLKRGQRHPEQTNHFEIITKDKYKYFSYWYPPENRTEQDNKVASILDYVYQKTNAQELEKSVSCGGWVLYIHEDSFLPDSVQKSELYTRVVGIIEKNYKVKNTVEKQQMPMIIYNSEALTLKQVNDLKIPISEIEIIELLKDVQAAAIYGSRAADGVIVIVTKESLNKNQSKKKRKK